MQNAKVCAESANSLWIPFQPGQTLTGCALCTTRQSINNISNQKKIMFSKPKAIHHTIALHEVHGRCIRDKAQKVSFLLKRHLLKTIPTLQTKKN